MLLTCFSLLNMSNKCSLFPDKQEYCVSIKRSERKSWAFLAFYYTLEFKVLKFAFQTAIYAVKQTVSSLELIGRYLVQFYMKMI